MLPARRFDPVETAKPTPTKLHCDNDNGDNGRVDATLARMTSLLWRDGRVVLSETEEMGFCAAFPTR